MLPAAAAAVGVGSLRWSLPGALSALLFQELQQALASHLRPTSSSAPPQHKEALEASLQSLRDENARNTRDVQNLRRRDKLLQQASPGLGVLYRKVWFGGQPAAPPRRAPAAGGGGLCACDARSAAMRCCRRRAAALPLLLAIFVPSVKVPCCPLVPPAGPAGQRQAAMAGFRGEAGGVAGREAGGLREAAADIGVCTHVRAMQQLGLPMVERGAWHGAADRAGVQLPMPCCRVLAESATLQHFEFRLLLTTQARQQPLYLFCRSSKRRSGGFRTVRSSRTSTRGRWRSGLHAWSTCM